MSKLGPIYFWACGSSLVSLEAFSLGKRGVPCVEHHVNVLDKPEDNGVFELGSSNQIIPEYKKRSLHYENTYYLFFTNRQYP